MIKRSIPALGTFVEISLPKDVDKTLFEKAFETLALVEEKLSFFNPESDVSHINALSPNVTLKIHPHTYTVLSFAQELSTQSDGIFDITIATILEKNGFLPPSASETRGGNYRNILLLDNSCIMLTQKVSIDLGGIAKGYGVDCVIKILKKYDVPYGSVNAGGDLRVFGDNPQSLCVRHPIVPHQTITLRTTLQQCCRHLSGVLFSNQRTTTHRKPPHQDVHQHLRQHQYCRSYLYGCRCPHQSSPYRPP
jgi:thiamine biosynthesis lipoprotein